MFIDDIITDDLSGFEGGNTPFAIAGETTTVYANEWTVTREDIIVGGKTFTFDVRYKFVNPILSSVALRMTNAVTRNNRIDFNATVVSKRELQVLVGSDWIDISDMCVSALRKANPNIAKSDADIILDLRPYGLDFTGQLPMYLQHLGANQAAFEQLADQFIALGARDNTTQVRARGQRSTLIKSLRHDEGVAIASLEVSKADRSRSATNSGFIGFLDASWGTLQRIISVDRQRSALRKALEMDPTNATAAAKEAEIRQIFSSAQRLRAFRNWGGTSAISDPLDQDKISYYAQQVPCGRLSVATAEGNQLWSVWGSRNDETITEVSTLSAPITADEEPF
jgi:hypothetical protein